MALVTMVKLELEIMDMDALELLCAAVTLATSDCRNQILTMLVRLDIADFFDRLLYAPMTDADPEHLIGQLHPAFASALTAAHATWTVMCALVQAHSTLASAPNRRSAMGPALSRN